MKEKRPSAKKTRGIFLPKYPGESVTSLPARVRPKAAVARTFLFILLMIAPPVMAQTPQPTIWKVLLAEASNQGYDGMYAVACVIRNRGGDLRGFCGAKRKDLSVFCNRQGRRAISQARDIEKRVFELACADTTGGATHFENVEAFGTPWWAKEMVVTVKIGSHTFYKKKESGR